ncbi:hypothetical protein QTI66_04215 [Variovorax sp. J22R133]|uniref:hypothetical protein n=1 Tax=Variovorax brevis TaxID=3053503 RepID=UPI0025769616|nr:hypothetical protein [Variovorax sp. J22R133]MDM0111339.1 hypothetical protein [Variovorax sp. J22R133]
MRRRFVFLAVALAVTGATAQVPIAGTGVGSPIKVQPIQIGPPADGGAAARRQGAQEPEEARQPAAPRTAPLPTPLGNCNAGGCWDSQGNRYNSTGDGSRYVSPEGRLCQTNGNFIHCN